MDAVDQVTDSLPEEFHQALEQRPGDFALLGALSDRLREDGDEVGAEALRWAMEKRREPSDAFGWVNDEAVPRNPNSVPWCLYQYDPRDNRYWEPNRVSAYLRLLWRYRQLTEAERKEVWLWEPPS